MLTSGNSVFCAGLDITEMYQPDPARLAVFWGSLQVAGQQICWYLLCWC